ncbi:MAG: NTP transferase domain-containing protein [Verrucomicrobia bacterium]|jgi:UTP--glucose-1-phosphate uridylyltransferase|nr:NTP transferase domain-containing protein [Verrucomicrobiota bacterium]
MAKALIPAAGMGTRYLPLSKAVPKELIPVNGFPVLHHVVAEAKAVGCREIGIVLSEGKEAIRTYFSEDSELLAWLDGNGKRHVMSEWEALMEGLTFRWIDQPEQRGLGDAIACGESFADGDPVCVLLGDTIMEGGSPLGPMVAHYRKSGFSQVAVEPVSRSKAVRYGVCGGVRDGDGNFQLNRMVEKPLSEQIPMMRDERGQPLQDAYAFAARYVLTPTVFGALHAIPPGHNGEVQLTDAMAVVLEKEGFGAVAIPGRRLDVGTR